MKLRYVVISALVLAVGVACSPRHTGEGAAGMAAPSAGTAANTGAGKDGPNKPKNDYNISINYELGMHCTGFDFSYCCVLPPYNSIQAQVIKTARGDKKWPEVVEADPEDHTVLKDGRKRFKLAYGHIDNTYSEGSKLAYWNVPYDVNGDGKYGDNENVANAYFTHLYVYKDLKGTNPKGTSKDSEKLFVGMQIPVPQDNGPAGGAAPSPMKGGFLHYTGEEGTIVYTKSPVLDNVPIVLTNPGIWDALGLPLTPFNDSVAAKNPLTLVESDIQPFQEAWVSLLDADSGEPVIDSHTGKPVTFVGTNPIDIPNCANCHASKTANGSKYNLYKGEYAFWKGLGASDWIASLKATSVSILEMHDDKNGTSFLKNYRQGTRDITNRLGRDPVLCQKCHADNVIGVIASKKMKNKSGKEIQVPALTQAIHTVHQTKTPLPDAEGRTASCQGCHPAHRQDGKMEDYPITKDGKNAYAEGDNRDASGGCYVGRDVHANRNKDKDGVGTKEYLNPVGQWLQANVSGIGNGKGGKGLWCTNCHNQLSRELYQRDNLENAFKQTGQTLRDKPLSEIAAAIGVSQRQLEDKYLDPKVVLNGKGEDTPGKSGILLTWAEKRTVPDIAVIALQGNGPLVSKDADGDINVSILSANPAVDPATLKLPKGATGAAAVPYDAATHGRDYWLSPGAPHCADCHAAPFVEGQGGVAYPINQPGKYSLMRYSKGHAGLACQTCHESIHGLYPVTSDTDVTSYRQAAQYNPDGSHGPLKCASCHVTNKAGVPLIADDEEHVWEGKPILEDFEAAVSWMHASAPDLGGKIPDID